VDWTAPHLPDGLRIGPGAWPFRKGSTRPEPNCDLVVPGQDLVEEVPTPPGGPEHHGRHDAAAEPEDYPLPSRREAACRFRPARVKPLVPGTDLAKCGEACRPIWVAFPISRSERRPRLGASAVIVRSAEPTGYTLSTHPDVNAACSATRMRYRHVMPSKMRMRARTLWAFHPRRARVGDRVR
jgi:hypothetical protein